MRLYHDEDADLSLLNDRRIAVIGYGNQGRAQALNLRDTGLEVVIGNRHDAYAEQAARDGFTVLPIAEAVAQANIVILLIPDEIMSGIAETEVTPHLQRGSALVFASGYTIAFGLLAPPPEVDVVLLAPRMIGAGVRDRFVDGAGFPAFIGVEQDHTGQAKALVLALARAIGATRMGVVEVTFAQEAELDLFTEQCFGPAFGAVLTSAVSLLIDEGYPPEAVLLELYMSGEFAYTLRKIAELGTVEQTKLHSRTSQYGSMSRGLRFQLPALRQKMRQGLEEIRSGAFAREWVEEQAEGAPTLELLREQAQSMPLYEMEKALRQQLGAAPGSPPCVPVPQTAPGGGKDGVLPPAGGARGGRHAGERGSPTQNPPCIPPEGGKDPGSSQRRRSSSSPSGGGWEGERASTPPCPRSAFLAKLRALLPGRPQDDAPPSREAPAGPTKLQPLPEDALEAVLRTFVAIAVRDPALQAFAQGRDIATHYVIPDTDLAFHLGFHQGAVTAGLGDPPTDADVRLTLDAATLDGMLTGTTNPARAALSGDIAFDGDTRLALTVQRVQKDLTRLYTHARAAALDD